MQKFDILIVGGGMVGLTLALAIRAQTKLTVAIADTTPVTMLEEKPEVRVSAINSASKQIFENISVWDDIQQQRIQPYQHMHIWDKAGIGKLDFSVKTLNDSAHVEQLGWIIENKVIRNALWNKAHADQGIEFYTDEAISNVGVGDSDVFASFASAPPITAKLLVGADGANSWVRQQLNMAITFRDYDHHAIVATVKCSQKHQNTAWQTFLPSGPLAFLPLFQEDLCSIVWSTSPEEAKRLSSLSNSEFSKEITAASDGKLGNITLESPLATYPLTMRFAQEFIKEKVALVGDAAHTIHPLAGQGVNLGLLDAASLVEVISEQLNKEATSNYSWCKNSVLNEYNRWRKSEASEMIAAMEAIKQVFTPQHAIPKMIRGIGMSLIDSNEFSKNILMKQALGYKGHLPTLAIKTDR